MLSQKSRRRVFLINPKFQWSFIGYISFVAVALMATFYAANAYFFWKFSKLGQEIGLQSDHVFFRFITEQKTNMDLIFVVTALCGMTFLILSGLYLSHKVAGPLYRLHQHFLSLKQSGAPLKEVRFRKGDYFPEIAESFNNLVKHDNTVKTPPVFKKIIG